MAEQPPLPKRIDSLSEKLVPPIPPKPVSRSPSKRLNKMATSENLAADSAMSQNFDAKHHYKSCFKTFQEFYKNGDLFDIELKVGDTKFKCHKIVISCVSEYFRVMFMSEMSESRQKIVTIHDIEESAMSKLINFAYTGKITFTIETVQPILYAASILQINTVIEACCQFMENHLHPTNCIDVHNFAEQHNHAELMKMADHYILDNFNDVVETDEFKDMSFNHLECLVKSQDLNVTDETQVYEAVLKWVKEDPESRRDNMSKLLSHIKLALLSPTYLVENVASEELVKKDLDCRDLLDDAKSYQMSLASLVSKVRPSEQTRPRKSCAGVLFCVGGRGASGDPFKSIECYDPRNDKWFGITEMMNRRRHVGVCWTGGLLYSVGGHDGTKHLNTGEVFDPKTNKWYNIAAMTTPRRGIALAPMGGAIYAVGGLDDTTCYDTVERYDHACDKWTFVCSMNVRRGGVGVTSFNCHLYAVGGNDGTSSLDRCEKYDPIMNKWSSIANMERPRAGAGLSVLEGYVYVVGGFDDSSPLNTCERYNCQTNKWERMADMTCARGGVGVSTMAGKVFAVGGHDGFNYLSSVEAYDPIKDSWTTVSNIQQCRAGAGLAFSECSPNLLMNSQVDTIEKEQGY
ncbi:kelch-like protein 8 [Mytilus galloprovincialis]|uniref:kelch-like protein 8 n=1 Tax=Mytilus galloprovincialis TaxID=29158 RepID=UPI003F7BF916